MKKEIEEDTNKWKNILCSWIGRINIINISILSKAIYRFKAIPIKIPMAFFTIFQNIYMEPQTTQLARVIFRKKNEVGGMILPDIKLYYKAIVINTAGYWHKSRHNGTAQK